MGQRAATIEWTLCRNVRKWTMIELLGGSQIAVCYLRTQDFELAVVVYSGYQCKLFCVSHLL